MTGSPYERLGGEAVRSIVRQLVTTASADLMIGFFFQGVDLEQVIQREAELAAAHLGGPRAYSGRPLPEAHGPHPIREGHFQRRLKLLEQALLDHDVPEDIRAAWLEHDRGLRDAVVAAGGCDDPLPGLVRLKRRGERG